MQTQLQAHLAADMARQGMDALLLVDPDNLGYVAGPMLPYVRHSPDRAVLALFTVQQTCTLFLPPDLAQAAQDQPCAAQCIAVPETAVGFAPLLRALRTHTPLPGTTWGIDFDETGCLFVQAVKAAFPDQRITDAGPLLRANRMIKQAEEIDRIEMACRQADTGIIGAINHMEGAQAGSTYDNGCYTVPECVERIRVHAYEGGTSLSGHMAILCGNGAATAYMPQKGFLPRQGLIRMEYDCCHQGYWSVNARMLAMGGLDALDSSQREAYAHNLLLKNTAIPLLTPGTPCSAIHTAVSQQATNHGILLLAGAPLGHGVGRSALEGPFLSADDETLLQANMVLAVDIITLAPHDLWIRSIDIYAVTDAEPRLLSWFRRWDTPYAVTGFRSAH